MISLYLWPDETDPLPPTGPHVLISGHQKHKHHRYNTYRGEEDHTPTDHLPGGDPLSLPFPAPVAHDITARRPQGSSGTEYACELILDVLLVRTDVDYGGSVFKVIERRAAVQCRSLFLRALGELYVGGGWWWWRGAHGTPRSILMQHYCEECSGSLSCKEVREEIV